MIKILFAPGCYGHFLSKCLYYFTDLSGPNKNTFPFDENSTSHDIRKIPHFLSVMQCGHPWEHQGNLLSLEHTPADQLITVVPCARHRLDYFDNQLLKNDKGKIENYIQGMFAQEDIRQKLITGWDYDQPFDLSTPRWIVREWMSFWINDTLDRSYDTDHWRNMHAHCHVTTQDLFNDLYATVSALARLLNVDMTCDREFVQEINSKFRNNQKNHGVQLRCESWVQDILDGVDTESPCQTLADEAWVQHLLRVRGYEIACVNLECFPRTAQALKQTLTAVYA